MGWMVWAGVLGSCALRPEYQRPENPVARDFVDNSLGQDAAGAWGELGWRGFFCDSTLRGLIDLALRENRDLRVAMLKVEQLRMQYRVTRADELPSVDAAGAITRQKSVSYTHLTLPTKRIV